MCCSHPERGKAKEESSENKTTAMKVVNKCSTSYGLIVKTENKIMLIKRKVPYCVQSFYMHLHRAGREYNRQSHHPFESIKLDFENNWISKLEKWDFLDYLRFKRNEIIEDLYDFPHGQLSKNKRPTVYNCFKTAYREFCEETGYKFSFTKTDIENYGVIQLQFTGCDNNIYTQYYFVVDNVKWLKRRTYFNSDDSLLYCADKIKRWCDDKLVFTGELVSLDTAYTHFKKQQDIKKDFKHLLCDTGNDNLFFKFRVNPNLSLSIPKKSLPLNTSDEHWSRITCDISPDIILTVT